jgi:hypothetical protein
MDYFAEDSAHVTSDFSLNEPAASNPEDRIIRKRWAKGLLAFYACLLLAGATAIGVYQGMTMSGDTEQHASLGTDVRSDRRDPTHSTSEPAIRRPLNAPIRR